MAAAEQVFAVLETPPAPHAARAPTSPTPRVAGHRGRGAAGHLSRSLRAGARRRLADGGAGRGARARRTERMRQVDAARRAARARSTPEAGSVRVGGVELAELDLDAWRARLAWVPQRPHLFAALDRREHPSRPPRGVDDEEVWAALAAAGLADVVRELPDGPRHDARRSRRRAVGRRATAGRAGPCVPARRAAAAARRADRQPRRRRPSRRSCEAVRRLARGRTVVLVAHRPALVGAGRPGGRARPRRGGRVTAARVTPLQPASRRTRGAARADARDSRARPPGAWRSRRCSGRARSAPAIGLIATSAWLISRSVAAPAGVRAWRSRSSASSSSPSRAGLCRYGERLVGHDAAFRVLARSARARLRTARAARAARPAGVPQRRSARAAGARRRLAAGSAAAGGAAVRDRARASARRRSRWCGGCCPAAGADPAGRAAARRNARAVADRARWPRAARRARRRRARS